MDRQEKNLEIQGLAEILGKAQVALCGDYLGLSVEQITNLRGALKKAGCVGKVVKNTLARRAIQQCHSSPDEQVTKFDSTFRGPTFLVYSLVDPVSPAKVIAEFCKTNEKFQVKGAFLEGRFLARSDVEALSQMPDKNQLIGQLLSLFNAPATRLVRVLSEPGAQLARVIEAQRKKLAGEV